MGGNCHRRCSDNGQRSNSSGTLQVLAQATNWDLQLVLAEAGNCWQQQGYGSGLQPPPAAAGPAFPLMHCTASHTPPLALHGPAGLVLSSWLRFYL